jgi:TolB protein
MTCDVVSHRTKPRAIRIRTTPTRARNAHAIDEVEADRATWSPAPYNEIAYAGRSAPGRYDIKVLDVASGRVRQITTGEGSNESPVFSPTGRHLAFTSTRTGGSPQIFTIGRDGNGLRQITRQGRNTTPAWSN